MAHTNTCYQECDYCRDYKKIYVRNKPVYYDKGAKKRSFLTAEIVTDPSFLSVLEGGQIMIVDDKYGGYYEILDAIKESSGKATAGVVISFEVLGKYYYIINTRSFAYYGSP
jgi:hypothetical protein